MEQAIKIIRAMIAENSERIASIIRDRSLLDLKSYNAEYFEYLCDLESSLIKENNILDEVITRLKREV